MAPMSIIDLLLLQKQKWEFDTRNKIHPKDFETWFAAVMEMLSTRIRSSSVVLSAALTAVFTRVVIVQGAPARLDCAA